MTNAERRVIFMVIKNRWLVGDGDLKAGDAESVITMLTDSIATVKTYTSWNEYPAVPPTTNGDYLCQIDDASFAVHAWVTNAWTGAPAVERWLPIAAV